MTLAKSNRHYPQLKACLDDWCIYLRSTQVEPILSMLSPNLRLIVEEERYEEKFRPVFIFGYKIIGNTIHRITEIGTSRVEATVIFGVLPIDSKKSYDDEIESGEMNFIVYRFQLIDLAGFWYVDDAHIYPDFWTTEFKSEQS